MDGLYGAHGKGKNFVQDLQSADVKGRHLHRWECNIDMDPKGAICTDVVWILLAQGKGR
jgi:hypothetical protein